MLPIERQQQILTWLEQEGTLRVSEISKRLDVSEMTVYRDLKPLIKQQKVIKTSNGITCTPQHHISANICSYCNKNSNTKLSVQLIKLNQQVEHTCCAHCGLLRYQAIEKEVSQIICYDFLKDTTISAKMATFLLNADVHLNYCQPQVITFDSLKQAKQFQLGFGGNIYNFEEAIKVIMEEMNGKTCCHSKK
ncbi:DeoR family transcriptional regulator [Alteribacillus bidgolensis]|uniref:DeoR-like helix-turn-helix domain-containing protein n=1 Tax=Alteribacillus bidgolensis TaxID=930129 RepID=A0A1G8D3H7_9BACI|nr:DeoR family transcriptional regulator [Alteribacillus bidgolensis]SDH51949.1 DeoR-like helix-turn-helix domain-containing protein [Alteribacillus bidgolensis]